MGVWLTSDDSPGGHGLEGAAADKSRYRLAFDLPLDNPKLHRWTDWAPKYATAETIRALASAAAKGGTARDDSWFVFFGVLDPTLIIACVDTASGEEVPNWGEICPEELSVPAVPPWRRDTWHKKLLKTVARAARGAA